MADPAPAVSAIHVPPRFLAESPRCVAVCSHPTCASHTSPLGAGEVIRKGKRDFCVDWPQQGSHHGGLGTDPLEEGPQGKLTSNCASCTGGTTDGVTSLAEASCSDVELMGLPGLAIVPAGHSGHITYPLHFLLSEWRC